MNEQITNEARLSQIVLIFNSMIDSEHFVTDRTGVKMVELIAPRIELNPKQPILKFGDVRKTPLKYCQAELEWYFSQDLSIEKIGKKAKIWKDCACKYGMVNSNYGWCIFSKDNGLQYEHVLDELLEKPESRRAVMIYNRPEMWKDYNVNGRNDFICTFATQHFIRDGELITVVNMRSNDFIFGLFNDWYWQAWVHNSLHHDLQKIKYPDLKIGKVIWIANSLHVYERHFAMIKKMANWILSRIFDKENNG